MRQRGRREGPAGRPTGHRRSHAAALLAGILACLEATGDGRASGPDGRIELSGRVTDAGGADVAGADVVLEGFPGGDRAAAVTDARGRFLLSGLLIGQHRLVVLKDGALLAARVIELRPAASLVLRVRGADVTNPAAPAGLAGGALAGGAAGATATATGGGDGPPVRSRDLGGLVAVLPSGAPPSAAGPGFLGAGQGDLRVTLDGIDLSDPVDGRVPLSMPLALAGDVRASEADPTTVASDRPGGNLRLSPRSPSRHAEAVGRVFGSIGPAGRLAPSAEGSGTAGDWPAASGGVEVFAARVLSGGRAALSVALAPRLDPRTAAREPDGAGRQEATRPHMTVPILAHAEARAGAWSFGASALLLAERERSDDLPRIRPVTEPDSRSDTLGHLAIAAFRRVGRTLVTFPVGTIATERRTTAIAGDVITRGNRLEIAPASVGVHQLGGWHVLEGLIELRMAGGSRDGPQPQRLDSPAVDRATASSRAFSIGIGDRWRPLGWLEVSAAVRVESMGAHGEASQPEPSRMSDLTFSPMLAPRFGVRAWDAGTGSGAVVAAGRFAAPLPIGPLLDSPGSQTGTITLPHEDVGLVGVELRRPGGFLALSLVDRRLRAAVEDQLGDASGGPAFANPDVRREYRAAIAQAGFGRGRLGGGASYTLASLAGNYAGYGEAESGVYRPGSTGQFDVPQLDVNRDGPLPLDRRHAVRAWARASARRGGDTLEATVAARADSGAPLSAVGRSAVSGPDEVFLVARGSLGRTPWSASTDARVEVGRLLRGARILVALEGFNLTHFRPVVAQDQTYTEDVVVPQPGSGADALAAARGPGGGTVTPNRRFLAPTAYADPLLLRLLLTVEM